MGCRAEFRVGFALCNQVLELAGDKHFGQVLVDRCLERHCEEFCWIKVKVREKFVHKFNSHLLSGAIGANNVFDFIVVRIQESVSLSAQPDPLAVLSTEAIHHREHLTFLLKNCRDKIFIKSLFIRRV